MTCIPAATGILTTINTTTKFPIPGDADFPVGGTLGIPEASERGELRHFPQPSSAHAAHLLLSHRASAPVPQTVAQRVHLSFEAQDHHF